MTVKFKLFISYSLFLLIVAFGCQFCFAQSEDLPQIDSFYRANFLYGQAQYDEAIKQYEVLIEQGLVSANLYYNLGNCYFKKGELGKAILYYERAKQLAPREADLDSNYAYARSLVEPKVVESAQVWGMRIVRRLFEKFTVDGLTVLIFFLCLAIVASIIVSLYFKFMKPYVRFALIIFVIMFIFGAIALGERITSLYTDAIVIEEAEARFEPFMRATVHFMLSEGMKVKIHSTKDGWVKVKRADGKVGWVSQPSLDKI